MPFKCLDQDFQKVCGPQYILKVDTQPKGGRFPMSYHQEHAYVSALSLQCEYQNTPFNEFARLQYQ